MASIALVFTVTAVAAVLLQRQISSILRRSGLMRVNWRGADVAPSGGIVVALASVVGYSVIALSRGPDILDRGLAFGIILSSYVGLFDDVAGRGSGKGFAGHLSESLSTLAISTGVVKAVFVSLAALIVARTAFTSVWEGLLRAGGIALTANLFNLLDLRPGRCIKAYLAVSTLTGILAGFDLVRFGPVIVGSLAVLPGDLRQCTMLGDGGSNLLGFALGAQIAYVAPLWFVLPWIATGLALNVASEKYSFTSIIESNRVLRWLDMLGRP